LSSLPLQANDRYWLSLEKEGDFKPILLVKGRSFMFKEVFESAPRDAFSSELATIAQLIQKILINDHVDVLVETEKLLKEAEEEGTLFSFGRFFEITEHELTKNALGKGKIRTLKRDLSGITSKVIPEQDWVVFAFRPKKSKEDFNLASAFKIGKKDDKDEILFAFISIYKVGSHFELGCFVCNRREFPDARPIVPQFRLPLTNDQFNLFSFDPNIGHAAFSQLTASTYHVDLNKSKSGGTKRLWKSMNEDSAEYEFSFVNQNKETVEVQKLAMEYKGEAKEPKSQQIFEAELKKVLQENHIQLPMFLEPQGQISFKIKAPKKIFPSTIRCVLSPYNAVNAQIELSNHYSQGSHEDSGKLFFKQINAYSDALQLMNTSEIKDILFENVDENTVILPGESLKVKIKNNLKNLDQQPLFVDFVFELRQPNLKDVSARVYLKDPNQIVDSHIKLKSSQRAIVLDENDWPHVASLDVINKFKKSFDFEEIKVFDRDFKQMNLIDMVRKNEIEFAHDLDEKQVLKDDTHPFQIIFNNYQTAPFLIDIYFKNASVQAKQSTVSILVLKNHGNLTVDQLICKYEDGQTIHDIAAHQKTLLVSEFEISNGFPKTPKNAAKHIGEFKLQEIKGYDIYYQEMNLGNLFFENLSVGSMINPKTKHTFVVKTNSQQISQIPLYLELVFQHQEDQSIHSLKFYLQKPNKVEYPASKISYTFVDKQKDKKVLHLENKSSKKSIFESISFLDKTLTVQNLEQLEKDGIFKVEGLDQWKSGAELSKTMKLSLHTLDADSSRLPKLMVVQFKGESPVIIYLQSLIQSPNPKSPKGSSIVLDHYLAKIGVNEFCFGEMLESQQPVPMKRKSLIQEQDSVQFVLQYARDLQSAQIEQVRALDVDGNELPEFNSQINEILMQAFGKKENELYPFYVKKDTLVRFNFDNQSAKKLHSIELRFDHATSVRLDHYGDEPITIESVEYLDDDFSPIDPNDADVAVDAPIGEAIEAEGSHSVKITSTLGQTHVHMLVLKLNDDKEVKIYLDLPSTVKSTHLHVFLKAGSFLETLLKVINHPAATDLYDLYDFQLNGFCEDQLFTGLLKQDDLHAYYLGSLYCFNYLQRLNKGHVGLLVLNVVNFATLLKYADYYKAIKKISTL
jgi:hypothetical protein